MPLYFLGVVDIYLEREKAQGAQIRAVAMLVREHPPPALRVVGHFNGKGDMRRLLSAGNQCGHAGEPDGKRNQK